ncbi:MAG: 2'-5' RNA ligase family protein, partial [Acidimicrobiales bacterium]
LGPVATFHPDTPVVYLAVGSDVDALRNLRDRVFTPPLARPLTWPFVPHVTLADEMVSDRIEAVVAALADYRARVVVDRVVLLREGAGREWTAVADAGFHRPVVVARGGLPVELWVSTIGDPEVDELLGVIPEPPPAGADPFAVAARRDGVLLGGARGWRRGGEVRLERLAVAAEAGLEDIERHLRRVALDLDG